MLQTLQKTKPRCTVLIVDDEPAIVRLLQNQLGDEFECDAVFGYDEAMSAFQAKSFDIVITDLGLGDCSGVTLLDWVCQHYPGTARVLISGMARLQDAADAINTARIHRLILKPWRGEDLQAHVREVAASQMLERNNARLNHELQTLNQNLERLVSDRTQELLKKNNILERMALTDSLTGLANRPAIEKIARHELLRRARIPAPVAFGMIDIDHFKSINTNYLHSGGDYMLASLSRVLQETIRGTDAIGRVGGEEFLVVAPDTDWDGAETLSERLRIAAEKCVVNYEGTRISVTISLGFAVADANTHVNYERMRKLAALALAEAKSGGRNKSVLLRYETSRADLVGAATLV
jgi:diguanylate cyclase